MTYQQVFDRAIGEPQPSTVDLDQAIRRQRRAARLRPALAGLVVLAVAAGATTAVRLASGEEAVPAQPVDELAGFPEYRDGTRVVAAASAPLARRTLTLTFVPTTLDLVLYARCDPRAPRYELLAELSAGEVTAELPYCPELAPGLDAGRWDSWEQFWDATGLAVGELAAIRVTLTAARAATGAASTLPERGTFGLAVAEQVPFDEYPLPPPPAVLLPLAPLPEAAGDIVVRAEPGEPNRRVEQEFRWDGPELPGCVSLLVFVGMVAQTPGSLRVLVNGVDVARYESWDYRQRQQSVDIGGACLGLRPGDLVTVAVEPEHHTGDWQVAMDTRYPAPDR